MNDKRREILIGYLLGALEPQESAKVEAELKSNEGLRNDLGELCREISPINEIVDSHVPPVGLANRTCCNIWSKIDNKNHSLESQITKALTPSQKSPQKRRITVVVSQNSEAAQNSPEQTEQHLPVENVGNIVESPLEPVISETQTWQKPVAEFEPALENELQELNTDEAIPLSRALRYAAPGKLRKPGETVRRVDRPEHAAGKAHLLLTESAGTGKGHQPKHYGRKTVTVKTHRPWTVRDAFASLLVGLTAAVLIFPVIQMGIGNFRDMIIQKKLQSVAKSMAPNTSQYSPYGFSQNDLRMLANMNIDPMSTSTYASQQRSTPVTFSRTSANSPSLPPTPSLLPAGLSHVTPVWQFASTNPDFLILDTHQAENSRPMPEQNVFGFSDDHAFNPLLVDLPDHDLFEMFLSPELFVPSATGQNSDADLPPQDAPDASDSAAWNFGGPSIFDIPTQDAYTLTTFP